MFQIDLKSRKPIYMQVIDNLKILIMNGILEPGAKVPSVRELSTMLTVNPNTIQKAYRELEQQGFIFTSPGRGSFVAEMDNAALDMERINEIREKLLANIRELRYAGLTDKKIRELIDDLLEEKGRNSKRGDTEQ